MKKNKFPPILLLTLLGMSHADAVVAAAANMDAEPLTPEEELDALELCDYFDEVNDGTK